tara:strand:- start:307 stop:2505 length:2199 start_codon:yes stop_codon:yes gene_type:complete
MGIRFGDSGAFTWLSGSDEGNLSIVGAITSSVVVEHSYEVSGAISTGAGVTASSGITASYGHYNNLAINDGGTKSIRLQPDGQLVMGGGGVLTIAGGAAGTTCLSASGDVNVVGNLFVEGTLNSTGAFAPSSLSSSGDLNIVGNSFMEGTLHVTGAVSGAVGISGVSISANDKAVMTAAGEISGSGPLNIVGAATLESTLSVTGAITTAAGISASLGVSGAYGHFNTLGINDGGTNNIALGAGVLINTGYFEISEMSAPGNPDSNKGRLYVADDSGTTKLFFKDSAGTATNLLAGGSGAVSAVANGADNRVATFSSGDALNGEANLTFDGSKLAVAGEISGSGVLNVVGLATLEGALNVTGAITTAAGLTASAGVSSSYGFVNNLGVNQGGTKSIQLLGSGLLAIIGGAAGTTCLSASGDVNVVGKTFMENTLDVTGAVSVAAGLTASAGVSSSYGFYNNLAINDGGTKSIRLQSNGQLIMGGGGVLTIAGGAAGTTCLSASGDVNVVGNLFIEGSLNSSGAFAPSSLSSSGDLNIVGNSFMEGTLNVTGAISTAAGVTASSGVSASYGNFNSVGINDGGTNSVIITGDGIVNATQRVTSALGVTGSSMLVNGKIHLNANGNIGGARSVSASLGITGSSLRINDTIHLNANGNITSVYNIYPAADNSYDLGQPSNRWRNIYTGDLHLSNETRGGGNEVDGTWGSYTIQEGENDLFLINKRTGQKLRFVTEEV